MLRQLIIIFGLLGLATTSNAAVVNTKLDNMVVNGSFSGDLKNGDFLFPGTPPDWNVAPNQGEATNSPDTMDTTANVGIPGFQSFGALPDGTPDGETWVGLARGTHQNERIGQTVNGFVQGTSYTISWYEGNFGLNTGSANDYLGANAIEVRIGNDFSYAITSDFPGDFVAVGNEWYERSFTFQSAKTGSYDISFGLISPTRAYMSLDGVYLREVSPVPEPSTYAMLITGVLLIASFQRKQRS